MKGQIKTKNKNQKIRYERTLRYRDHIPIEIFLKELLETVKINRSLDNLIT